MIERHVKSAEIGFDSQTILRDDGTGAYEKPQWVDGNGNGDVGDAGDRSYPVSYVRSRPGSDSRITINLKLTVEGTLNGKYLITGGAMGVPGGLTWQEELTVAKGSTVLETSITSIGKLADKIDNVDFTIPWKIAHLAHEDQYNSAHHAYITGAPASGHYQTVLDIGCYNAKGLRPGDPGDPEPDGTNRSKEVVDAIWEDFSNNVVYRVDGMMMRYNHDPGKGNSAAEMLAQAEGRGQCTAWAELLVLTLEAQGLTATSTRIDPPAGAGNGFAVKSMPAQGSGGADYTGGTFPDGFSFHQVVRVAVYPDRIYDPSYGGLTLKADARSVELLYEDKYITHFWFADPAPGRWVANVLGDPPQLRFTP